METKEEVLESIEAELADIEVQVSIIVDSIISIRGLIKDLEVL